MQISTFPLTARLELLSSAVREAYASQHMGAPFRGNLKPIGFDDRGVSGGPFI